MGRGAEAVHEGRDVWGRAYAQMSLGNLAARSVLIDATEGWSAGEKPPSPGAICVPARGPRLECSNSSDKPRVWFGTTPAPPCDQEDFMGRQFARTPEPACRPGGPTGDPKVLWAAY